MNFNSEISNIKLAFSIVFAEKKYYLVTIFIAMIIVSFLNFAVNLDFITHTITSDYALTEKLGVLVSLFGGIASTNTELTLFSLIIVGILAGINTSFILHKYHLEKKIQKSTGLMGALGTFAGIFAGGCASCALSVAALLGVTGGLTFLPFQGFELTIIGIAILFVSLSWSAKSVLGLCNIKSTV
tara:strand:- start:2888 stop:3442 length:555 start_codon:yes stop_codon:yes gene_type:complete